MRTSSIAPEIATSTPQDRAEEDGRRAEDAAAATESKFSAAAAESDTTRGMEGRNISEEEGKVDDEVKEGGRVEFHSIFPASLALPMEGRACIMQQDELILRSLAVSSARTRCAAALLRQRRRRRIW